jgi:glycosyltransferase involved in cell wall biosynthesis
MSNNPESFANAAVSLVIPVYHAHDNINRLVVEAITFFSNAGLAYEIILVDDCSTDGTWSALKSLYAQFPETVKCYHLKSNLGQYGATITGISKSSGNYIITIDDDFNPHPGQIGKLISIKDDCELAYGNSKSTEKNLLRRGGSWAIHLGIMITTGRFKLSMGSSFRLFNRSLWNRMQPKLNTPEALDIELLRNARGKIIFIETESNSSPAKSSHSSIQLIKLALKILLSGLSKDRLQMQKLLAGELIDGELNVSRNHEKN